MAETLIPTSMVPGLVTIKGKDGKMQNVFPIDAKELIYSGEFELVDNGSIEASRMNANPLKSGRAGEYDVEKNVIVEVTGIEGRVLASNDEKVVREARENSSGPDGTQDQDRAARTAARQDEEKARQSADQPKTDAEKRAEAQRQDAEKRAAAQRQSEAGDKK